MKLKKLLLALCIITALIACKTGDKLALKLNYEKGKKYYYTSVSEQNTTTSIMGINTQAKSTTTSGYIWEVKDIDKDGNYHVTITYDKIESKVEGSEMGQTNTDFLRGFTFEAVVTPKGQILKVKGMDKLLDKAFEETIPDSLTTQGADTTVKNAKEPINIDAVKQMIKTQYNDESMGKMIAQMTDYFPEGEVEVGDKWEKTVEINMMVTMTITTNYILKDIKDGIAVVDMESKISTKSEGLGALANIEGTQKGTMEIDTKNGLIVKSNVNQDMSGNMGMMKITGTTTVEAKEMN